MSLPDDAPNTASVAKRLDREWHSKSLDSRLDLIAALGEAGLPVALGLLVNGTIIRGVVGPISPAAGSIASAVDRAVEELFPNWPPEVSAAATEALRNQEQRLESRRVEDQEVFDRYFDQFEGDFGVDDVALEDIPHVTRATRSHSTISVQQASIDPPNGSPVRVNYLQLSLQAVDAWWVLDDEEGANVNYSPTST